jgi:hypothetical protein
MPPEIVGPAPLAGGNRAGGINSVPCPDTGAARSQQALDAALRYAARVDFARVNHVARAVLPRLLERWLPGGRIEGAEYVVRNPKRHDQRPGSFKVNLATGRWADFAIGDKGGDPISLAAYLAGCSQIEAARRLAAMLGIGGRDGR